MGIYRRICSRVIQQALYAAVLVMMLAASSLAAGADVVISEIMYNPSSVVDTAGEWIELHNNGVSPVDLADWQVNGNDFEDITIQPDEYIVVARKLTGLVGEESFEAWYGNGDGIWDASDANFRAVDGYFSLTNTGGTINLSDGYYADIVSYLPSMGADGNDHSLERLGADTWNESSALYGTPGKPNGASQGQQQGEGNTITILADVGSAHPVIGVITIGPDEGSLSGVQVIPNPGAQKNITVTVLVSDPNGAGDIATVTASVLKQEGIETVTLSGQGSVNQTSASFTGVMQMDYYNVPGGYLVRVNATDSSGLKATGIAEFDYMEVIAMQLDATQLAFEDATPGELHEVTGDYDPESSYAPTLRNIGNAVLNAEVSGTALSNGGQSIGVENIKYRFFQGDYQSVSTTPAISAINLEAGEMSTARLDLALYIPPGTTSGNYAGSVTIAAVS
ncbi:TPA: lamin tail domain-containing protein [Candidatus Woesearchaeota archaeon]|nr:lamin tail domain-containing protein [Candidatus Woesearchaeota archaeon]